VTARAFFNVATRDVDLAFHGPAIMARNRIGMPIESLITVPNAS